jgi:hypothetical protein
MRDYITIAPSPIDEDCAQVGSPDYEVRSKRECKAFLAQLRRQFGDEPGSACLAVKFFPHDFGTYREVVCYYDDEDEEGYDYAMKLESETPAKWDEEAKEVLASNG